MSHDAAPHSQSRRDRWNERYADAERVWSAEPNEHVAQIVVELMEQGSAGAALDLGAGEGRHALWLAEQGWQVTAVDFAQVGLDRGSADATARGLAQQIEWVTADVTTWAPEDTVSKHDGYDLVLIAFLHVPEDVLARAVDWLRPGGALVLVGHALRNLTDGHGGPQDPDLLYSADQLRTKAVGLHIERLEEVDRVTAEGRTAIDIVLVGRRT
ncbi:MAG: class I SAM-dependent methyltransferase [Actinomycetia bacterium]|nr:class I SAM-dependent methyltransferase [Actinomycetes bacterium]